MTTQELSVVDKFKGMLASDAVQSGFGAVLPPDVDQEKFTAVVIRAVQEDPDILAADRKSLFLACQDAASDGLVPDKREGALVVYSSKVNDQWVKKVQWQPMVGGMRKNLARAGFDIRSEVICENDFFDQELGDTPAITHKPPQLGQDRGKVIGAYAIATHIASGEKYREVMSYPDLEFIRSLAKSKGIWDKHTNEMYRKTVARKLIKFLPLEMEFDRIFGMMDRDNASFQDTDTGPTEAAKTVQKETRKTSKKTATKKPALPKVKAAPKVVTEVKPPPATVEPGIPEETGDPGPSIPGEVVAANDGPGF